MQVAVEVQNIIVQKEGYDVWKWIQEVRGICRYVHATPAPGSRMLMSKCCQQKLSVSPKFRTAALHLWSLKSLLALPDNKDEIEDLALDHYASTRQYKGQETVTRLQY